MKKLLFNLSLFSATWAFAQTQRISLYEEFTGENCGPCAMVNPSITTLVLNNPSKIILLRYMVPIPSAPGAGSLYKDNPVEIDARKNYYGVPFAPYARINGILVPATGHAGDLSQRIIDSAYAVPSPFSLTVSHQLNANADSLSINIKATAAEAYAPNGVLKLQCALTEEFIHFDKAPGSNGERDFEFIMRKMLPDANGTAMTPGSWTNGQTQNITLKAKIPAYIKDKTQLAVVVFIQDNGNKKVLNAAYSEVAPLPTLDAVIKDISNGIIGCTSSFAPVVSIKNSGTPVLTSAVIDYSIDNGSMQTYHFSGNLASGAVAHVSLPSFTFTNPGAHTITATVKSPNGQVDMNTLFDTKTTTIFNYANPVLMPFKEGFTSSTFPPTPSWLINDMNKYGYPWENSYSSYPTLAGSATGGGAAWIHAAWVQMKGVVNEMILPLMSLGNNPVLTFHFAAAEMTGNSSIPNEKIEVLASSDCGVTWKTVHSKMGAAYYTHAAASDFVPKVASDWRKETVSLAPVQNSNEVIIKFVATSGGFGTNNIFLDDINIIDTPVEITEKNNATFKNAYFMPNPATDYSYLHVFMMSAGEIKLTIQSLLGQTLYSAKIKGEPGENHIALDGFAMPEGLYHAVLSAGGENKVLRLIISK